MKTRPLLIMALLLLFGNFLFAQVPEIEWHQDIDGKIDYESLCTSHDGGMVLLSNEADGNYVFTNMDLDGNTIWSTTHDIGDNMPYGGYLRATDNGGYVFFAEDYNEDTYESTYYLVKLDGNGNEISSILLDLGEYSLYEPFPTSDGGYVYISENEDEETKLAKMDQNGNVLWEMPVDYYLISAIETEDGGYLLSDVNKLYKYDSNRNLQWENELSIPGYDVDDIYIQDKYADGGYLLTADLFESDTYHSWVLKVDANGAIVWNNVLDGEDQYAQSFLAENQDAIVYEANSNFMTCYDPQGNTKWGETYNPSGNESSSVYYAIQSADNGIAFYYSYWENSLEHFDLVKLSPYYMATNDVDKTQLTIYPNPVKETVNFSEKVKEIQIFSLDGKLVKQYKNSTENLNVNGLPVGNYVVKGITNDGIEFTTKMIKR